MDIALIKAFFSENGYSTALIGVFLTVVELLAEKFGKDKIPKPVKRYLPVALSVVLHFVFICVAEKRFIITLNTLYSALISYFLSVLAVQTVKRVKKGEFKDIISSEQILNCISEIIDGYVSVGKKSELASRILDIVFSGDEAEQIKTAVKTTLLAFFTVQPNDGEIQEIVNAIIEISKIG